MVGTRFVIEELMPGKHTLSGKGQYFPLEGGSFESLVDAQSMLMRLHKAGRVVRLVKESRTILVSQSKLQAG